jgi:hypothetical protein
MPVRGAVQLVKMRQRQRPRSPVRELRPGRWTHGALYPESQAPIGIGIISAYDDILRCFPLSHGSGKFKFRASNDCS